MGAGGMRPSVPVETIMRVEPEDVNWALPTLTKVLASEDRMLLGSGDTGVLEGGGMMPSVPVEKKV